jgi:type II secretory pathway pseudopilin PulG
VTAIGRRGSHLGSSGYSLIALMVAITVMMILMAAAVPSLRYVVKNDREEELLFRGGEIADAIIRYQRKHASAYPPSLEAMVQGRFLRKLYKDPMSKDGKWRLLRQGEALAPAGQSRPDAEKTRAAMATAPTMVMGPIIGVASRSREKSLRILNGRTRYDEWYFVAGQPRVVGRTLAPTAVPAQLPGGMPGGMPSAPTRPGSGRQP